MTVKQMYERELKRARDRRDYYQKKYGIELPKVKRVKKPDRQSVEALKKKFTGGQKIVKRMAARYSKRRNIMPSEAPVKSTAPNVWDIMRDNIIKYVEEGMNDVGVASSFTKWKAETIWEKLEELKYKGSLNWKMVWERWGEADAEIERFIFDSGNRKGVNGFLQRVEGILLGGKSPAEYLITDDEIGAEYEE